MAPLPGQRVRGSDAVLERPAPNPDVYDQEEGRAFLSLLPGLLGRICWFAFHHCFLTRERPSAAPGLRIR